MALVPIQFFALTGTVTPLVYGTVSGTAQFSQRAVGTNPAGAVGGPLDPVTVRVVNWGPGNAWVAFGGSVTAVSTAVGMLIPPSTVSFLDPGQANFIAAIGTAAGNLNIAVGIGGG